MKNSHLVRFIVIFISITAMALGFQTGVIIHQPIMDHSSDKPIVLYATVSADQDPEDVRIMYRREGDIGFVELFMVEYNDMWRGEIPTEDLDSDILYYFIASTLTDGTVLTFPADDPENALFSINIFPPEPIPMDTLVVTKEDTTATSFPVPGTGEGEILIFSPEPGSSVPFDDVYIALSLFNIDSVDVTSVRLLIDDRDVTASSSVSDDVVYYSSPVMSPGTHSARVELKTVQGLTVPEKRWSFNVVKKRAEEIEREFTYRGRMNSGYSLDQIEGEELAVGKTTVSLTGEWRWLKMKADMKITSDEDPLKQPKNRYKFSINAGKYLSLNLGDSNARLSKFTLDGKRVRGVDANLQLGLINFHLIKGELDRSIKGPLTVDNSLLLDEITVEQNQLDSTLQDITYFLDRKGYAFQKDLTALRLSFGRGKLFQWGVNLLKVKDNIASVDSTLGNAKIYVDADSLGSVPLNVSPGEYTYDELWNMISGEDNYSLQMQDRWSGNTPQDNIVIGSDVKMFLHKRKIGLEAGFAFSMLNKDIWDGPMTLADLDILMDDSLDGWIGQTYDEDGNIETDGFFEITDEIPDPADYEDIFVLNPNMVPLIPIDPDSAQLAEDPLKAVMNMPSLAYNAKVSLNYFGNNFIFEYIKVGPEFNSLGNPYIQKNYKEYSFQDRLRLLKNRIFLTLMYKHQDNDVLRIVPIVTTQEIVSFNANIFPGPNLPAFTLGYRTLDRDNGKTLMDTVSVAVDTVTSRTNYWLEDHRDYTKTLNRSFGVKYQLHAMNVDNNISLNLISVTKTDEISDRAEAPFYSTSDNGVDTTYFDSSFVSPNLKSDIVTISLVTEFPFPLKTTTVVSLNNSEFGKNAIYGTQEISSYSLNAVYDLIKGKLKLLGGLNYTSGSGNDEFTRMGFKAGVNYRLTNHMSLRVNGELRSKSIEGETKSSTLLRASLNYSF